MRLQHVKGEELDGPIKLEGFEEWAGSHHNGSLGRAILLVGAPGSGKGSAVGRLAANLRYDIVRCRVSQLLDYPDPCREFRALLEGTEHMKKTLLWLDGLDRLLCKISEGASSGQQILADWLKNEAEELRQNEILVVATAKSMTADLDRVSSAFDRSFTS